MDNIKSEEYLTKRIRLANKGIPFFGRVIFDALMEHTYDKHKPLTGAYMPVLDDYHKWMNVDRFNAPFTVKEIELEDNDIFVTVKFSSEEMMVMCTHNPLLIFHPRTYIVEIHGSRFLKVVAIDVIERTNTTRLW